MEIVQFENGKYAVRVNDIDYASLHLPGQLWAGSVEVVDYCMTRFLWRAKNVLARESRGAAERYLINTARVVYKDEYNNRRYPERFRAG